MLSFIFQNPGDTFLFDKWVCFTNAEDLNNNIISRHGTFPYNPRAASSITDAVIELCKHLSRPHGRRGGRGTKADIVTRAVFVMGINANNNSYDMATGRIRPFGYHCNILVVNIIQGVPQDAWVFEPHARGVGVPRLNYLITAMADALGVVEIRRCNGLQGRTRTCTSHAYNALAEMIINGVWPRRTWLVDMFHAQNEQKVPDANRAFD